LVQDGEAILQTLLSKNVSKDIHGEVITDLGKDYTVFVQKVSTTIKLN
jgi:hypothetical protein